MPQFNNIYTYENIQKLKMAVVPETLDTREGSVIWNAVAANSVEMALAFAQMSINQDNAFPDTANREYLIRHCAMRGITPYPATSAVIQGEFYENVVDKSTYDPPLGTRFSVQNTKMIYKVTEKISDGNYKLVCETPGTAGNISMGTLVPVDEKNTIGGASIVGILDNGEEEEETEALRERYMESLKAQPFAGNKAAYREMCRNLDNVGACKVYRAYQGQAGHVGLCILDANMNPPDAKLLTAVQNQIDPNEGDGTGLAPIDHKVHVFAPTEKTIDVSVTVKPFYGTEWDNLKASITKVIQDYFDELRSKWDESDIYISPYHISARLLGIDTIQDVKECLINGKSESINLESTEIPKVGEVSGGTV